MYTLVIINQIAHSNMSDVSLYSAGVLKYEDVIKQAKITTISKHTAAVFLLMTEHVNLLSFAKM